MRIATNVREELDVGEITLHPRVPLSYTLDIGFEFATAPGPVKYYQTRARNRHIC